MDRSGWGGAGELPRDMGGGGGGGRCRKEDVAAISPGEVDSGGEGMLSGVDDSADLV